MADETMDVNLKIEGVEGLAPVQAYGTLNEWFVYFRARYDTWVFSLGTTATTAISAPFYEIVGAYGAGGAFAAGAMPEDEVRAIMQCCAQQYVAARRAAERRHATYERLRSFVAPETLPILAEMEQIEAEAEANQPPVGVLQAKIGRLEAVLEAIVARGGDGSAAPSAT